MHCAVGICRVRRCWDRVARLVAGDGGVRLLRQPAVAGLRPGARVVGLREPAAARVEGVAVVGVDDVAGGAAARAVVARVVVRPEHVQRRVEEARALQVQPHRVGAVVRPEPAVGEAVRRAARLLVEPEARDPGHRVADRQGLLLPALEDAEDVRGLADLEARERAQEGEHALRLPGRRLPGPGGLRRQAVQARRGAVDVVGLAEAGRLLRVAPVVVEGRLPQHGAVGHHAPLGAADVVLGVAAVAADRAARERGHAQVARVHEPDVLPALLRPVGVADLRIRGGGEALGAAGQDVGLVAGGQVGRRVARDPGRPRDRGVAAVAVGAADAVGEAAGLRRVEGVRVRVGLPDVARDAPLRARLEPAEHGLGRQVDALRVEGLRRLVVRRHRAGGEDGAEEERWGQAVVHGSPS